MQPTIGAQRLRESEPDSHAEEWAFRGRVNSESVPLSQKQDGSARTMHNKALQADEETMMRMPNVHGVIRRRLLVNFRVDPAAIRRSLPSPFQPKLQDGYAVAGICLIRLEQIRPKFVPSVLGISSENAAHRIAVTWEDATGPHEGVYIPRRDSNSMINHLAGGRLFPGEHNRAKFDVEETDNRINFRMESTDQVVKVDLSASVSAQMPQDSCFRSLQEASKFFEGGSLGYSATSDKDRLDGIELRTQKWLVSPLAVERVHSSYFADKSRFPEGSAQFDCALIMRNIEHEWLAASDLHIPPSGIR